MTLLRLVLSLLGVIALTPWTQAQSPKAAENEIGMKPYGNVFVLLIGVTETRSRDFARLSTDLDVKAVAEVFRTVYGYKVLAPIVGPDANRANVLARIKTTLDSLGPDDVLILYWGGHGHRVLPGSDATLGAAGEGFLLTADTDLRESDRDLGAWKARSVQMRELASLVEATRARHAVLILDSCYSGLVRDYRTRASGAQARAPEHVRRLLNGRSRFVLTAGRSGETAVEVEGQGGLFSQELARLLKGANGPLGLYELRADLQRAIGARIEREAVEVTSRGGVKRRAAMTPSGGELLKGEEAGEFYFLPTAWQNSTTPAQRQASWNAQWESRFTTRAAQYSGQAILFRVLTEGPLQLAKNPAQRLAEWKRLLEELTDQASLGDPVSMAALSHAYGRGFGGSHETGRAFDWAWQSAVERGSAEGKFALAEAIHLGAGTESNPALATALIEEAAAAGYAPALTERANRRIEASGEIDRSAIDDYRRAAESGYLWAQLRLALLVAKGTPAVADAIKRPQAELWARAGAEGGNATAMYVLHRLLSVNRPSAESVRWLNQAVQTGHADASVDLARAYRPVHKDLKSLDRLFLEETRPIDLTAFGIQPNLVEARRLAQQALDRGSQWGALLLAELAMYHRKTSDGGETEALALLQGAYKAGLVDALAALVYWRGQGFFRSSISDATLNVYFERLPENNPLGLVARAIRYDLDVPIGRVAWEQYPYATYDLNLLVRASRLGSGLAQNALRAVEEFGVPCVADEQRRELAPRNARSGPFLHATQDGWAWWRRRMVGLDAESKTALEHSFPGFTADPPATKRCLAERSNTRGPVTADNATASPGTPSSQPAVATPSSSPPGASARDGKNDVSSVALAGLQWASRDNGTAIAFAEAKSYCDSLASTQGPWRLPTARELEALYRTTGDTPPTRITCAERAQKLYRVPGIEMSCNAFWTSAPGGRNTNVVYFFNGSGAAMTGPSDENARALCVR